VITWKLASYRLALRRFLADTWVKITVPWTSVVVLATNGITGPITTGFIVADFLALP
jgi:hypothetical protein